MTFSGQDPRQRSVEDTDNFKAIVSGGLNTNGNRLLMSGDDSPELYNVEVTSSGALAKRKAFKQEYPLSAWSAEGSLVVPWKSIFGYQMYILKTEVDLQVVYQETDGTWVGNTYANTFPNRMSTVRPDHVLLSEPDKTRVVFVSDRMVPTQLSIREHEQIVTLGAPANSVTIDAGLPWRNVTDFGDIILYIDGVRRTTTSVTNGGGATDIVIGFSGTALGVGNHTVQAIAMTRQWWAEAIKVTGNQLIDQQVQSTASKHVPIPEKIRQNISEIGIGLYPIRVYTATTYGTYLTRVTNLTPTLASEYSFSIGVDSAPNCNIPSPNWITTGAVPGAARTLTFHRYHVLPFSSRPDANLVGIRTRYGILGWTFSGSVPPAEGGVGTGGATFSYGMIDVQSGGFSTVALGTTTIVENGHAIRLDQTSTGSGGISIPQDDIYSIVARDPDHLIAQDFVGSFAANAPFGNIGNEAGDGAPVAVYGLWEAAHYGTGSFPSTICLFQNRLALGGFPGNAMHILISAVSDTSVPGEYNNNFQIFYEDGNPTDPLDVQLPGRGDDAVLCLREFQASLFAFTRYNVFRITGTDGAISPSSFYSSRISTLGTVNALSVASGNNTLYFLNGQGVYSIRATDDAGGYTTEEISIKIKNLFKSRPYIELTSYMCFDPENNRLYLGISDEYGETIANQMFVYQIDRDAWFLWTDDGGDTLVTSYAAMPSILTGLSSPVFLYSRDGAVALYSMYQDRFSDVKFSTAATTPSAYHIARIATHTTEADVTEYYTTQAGGANVDTSFRMFPVPTYQDCDVYLSGNKLVWGVDYQKTDRSSIILTNPVSAGLTLEIRMMWRYEDTLYYPTSVYVDNRWVEPTEYSVTISGGYYVVTWNMGYTPSGTITYCSLYPAYYITPVFTRSRLSTHKRQFHYYGYYDNSVAGKVLKSTDVTVKELVGARKHDIDFDMAFIFNSESWGATTNLDIYGFESLHWDYGVVEFGSPEQGQKEFSRIVVPVIGAGYGFQTAHLCFTAGTFQLVGYEIRTRSRRSRGFSYVD